MLFPTLLALAGGLSTKADLVSLGEKSPTGGAESGIPFPVNGARHVLPADVLLQVSQVRVNPAGGVSPAIGVYLSNSGVVDWRLDQSDRETLDRVAPRTVLGRRVGGCACALNCADRDSDGLDSAFVGSRTASLPRGFRPPITTRSALYDGAGFAPVPASSIRPSHESGAMLAAYNLRMASVGNSGYCGVVDCDLAAAQPGEPGSGGRAFLMPVPEAPTVLAGAGALGLALMGLRTQRRRSMVVRVGQ